VENATKIIILGWIAYLACLFLPAYADYPGFVAAMIGFSWLFVGEHKSILLEFYVFMLSLTHFVMLASLYIIKKYKHGNYSRYRWVLI